MSLNRRQFLGGAIAASLATLAVPVTADSPAPAAVDPGSKPRLTGIKRVIVDTDPGNDDALAILLALHAPSLQVEAVTVCPGNLGPNYAQQVKNALFLVDLAGKGEQVAVHAGIGHPLLNIPYPVATFIHGKYGLGAIETPTVSEKVSDEHAVDAIIRIAKANPGEITILALGGLTNVAVALLREPRIAKDLKGILFVGGRYHTSGNFPGYNVLVDPEAAKIVFASGVPMIFSGDATGADSIMMKEDFDHIATFNTKLSRFFIESNTLRRTFETTVRHEAGGSNPDGLAVAIAAYPEIATSFKSVYVEVELQGKITRGCVCFDMNRYSLEPTPPSNVDICLSASNTLFKKKVFEMLSSS